MPKIIISTSSFDVNGNLALQALCASGYELLLNPYGRRLTEAEAGELLRQPDVVAMIAGTEPLTADALHMAPDLKVISRCGIGIDNVDLAAARERGIDVLNTPDALSLAVAELTLGLMLAALRRIPEADRMIRSGAWQPLMGGLLGQRVVGVVGYGRIGRKVSQLARAFGARVVVHDVRPIGAGADVEPVDFDRLLAESDIVTLHVPSNPDRRCLIDAMRLARMKKGAILINTARGELVDEQALLQALNSGQLAAAALDTFGDEPYKGPLAALSQVTLTAHMGSYAQEGRAIMEVEAARNLVRALEARGMLACNAPDGGSAGNY